MPSNKSILLIDKSGEIIGVLRDDLNIIEKISDKNVLSILDENSKFKFLSLLAHANLGSFEIAWDINLKLDNQTLNLLTVAIKDYENYNIVFLKEIASFDEIINELMRVNNEQINNFRRFLKENNNKSSNELLEELSKINNELIDTRRELIKKKLELEELNRKLSELSIRDELTGLYNRRFLKEIFPIELGKVRRYGFTISLIFIDLNNFKVVNDTLGHSQGDSLLTCFANISLENTRKDVDYIFRLGGDEFLILLIGANTEDALNVAERINEKIKEKSNNIVSLAYGILEINTNNVEQVNLDNVLKQLDDLMYEHKKLTKLVN